MNGRSDYQSYGEIIGDAFETPKLSDGVTINADFNLPAGTSVEVYLSWTKKTDWNRYPIWESSTPGDQSITGLFVALPGITTDYFYNVRWKIKMFANDSLEKSPIVEDFSIEYTDPGNIPSDEFMAAQNSASSTPVNKIQLVLVKEGDDDEKIDITDRVISVSNLSQEIPVKPNKLGNIVADDVTIKVENTDGFFSELNPESKFYDRFYLNDEIRIFSGFTLLEGDEFAVTGRFNVDRIDIDNRGEAQIYCRSLLRESLDKIIGMPEDNQANPKFFSGKVKAIMETLLTGDEYAGISAENVHIEDLNWSFYNISVEEETVGEVLQKLAQACDGVVYTNNQGDIYFKSWTKLTTGTYDIKPDVNMIGMRYTGQRRDRLVKKAIVKGAQLVQGTCVSELGIGRDITIKNKFVQVSEQADYIAGSVIKRYGQDETELELWSAYLPSVKILDTVQITEPLSGLSGKKFLVNSINKNITEFNEQFRLTSNLAKK